MTCPFNSKEQPDVVAHFVFKELLNGLVYIARHFGPPLEICGGSWVFFHEILANIVDLVMENKEGILSFIHFLS